MTELEAKEIIYTVRVVPRKACKNAFLMWTTRFNTIVASFKGFISIDISISAKQTDEWIITQRFIDIDSLNRWRRSEQYQNLIHELDDIADQNNIKQVESAADQIHTGVTEVIVTQVTPGKEREFREWMAKIHEIEARFVGFRGAYVQSPTQAEGTNWITLLQFDTPEHLDQWISSAERKKVLKEAGSLISSLEQHRVISPYAGWFSSISSGVNDPPAWKQAMIVLLFLFPIVMLEMKYLNPLLVSMNSSSATFIGNVISVALLTWVMIPIGIRYLGWWLIPKDSSKTFYTTLGVVLLLAIYFFEVLFFNI